MRALFLVTTIFLAGCQNFSGEILSESDIVEGSYECFVSSDLPGSEVHFYINDMSKTHVLITGDESISRLIPLQKDGNMLYSFSLVSDCLELVDKHISVF